MYCAKKLITRNSPYFNKIHILNKYEYLLNWDIYTIAEFKLKPNN